MDNENHLVVSLETELNIANEDISKENLPADLIEKIRKNKCYKTVSKRPHIKNEIFYKDHYSGEIISLADETRNCNVQALNLLKSLIKRFLTSGRNISHGQCFQNIRI